MLSPLKLYIVIGDACVLVDYFVLCILMKDFDVTCIAHMYRWILILHILYMLCCMLYIGDGDEYVACVEHIYIYFDKHLFAYIYINMLYCEGNYLLSLFLIRSSWCCVL